MRIGRKSIGRSRPCYVVGEIGINHNGDLDNIRMLIAAAAVAGFDAVKFQTRTIDAVYSEAELEAPRDHPWGTTNGELKRRLELTQTAYHAIDVMCQEHGIAWFTSPWDKASVDRISLFRPPCYKIPSALLTDLDLIDHVCSQNVPVLLSTGMSTYEQIDAAVDVVRGRCDFALLHCTSTYPCPHAELNLRVIGSLSARYGCAVGYSGHEVGLTTTYAAVAMGACIVERHITLDRTMFGSDQAASIEPQGMLQLVKGIRAIEDSLGDGIKRVYESELPALKKLRRQINV